ncbi:MAG: FKBP-type peptidyl-prolyl cis-trans isomerase [Anaerolineae bacterium]|nr:FKBP-type peptidyl-prolyl cis-trans isomerase [Anaerolineae bacterium]
MLSPASTSAVAPTPGEEVTLDSGIKLQDIVIGTGAEAKVGSYVEVNYRGLLENGTQFDSSYDRKQTLPFSVGAGQMIQGFDVGVRGMKVGGKRKVTIPPELGYGAQGVPGVIPPNSVLIFEIELMSVK